MTDTAIQLLTTCGADRIEHPGGTLLAHLQRVSSRLSEWGARPALRQAGLCHAFYGTDGFATSLWELDRRPELATAIGAEAETLVYFYASCDRRASYPRLAEGDGVFLDRFTGDQFTPTPDQRRDFAELTAANELDLAHVNPAFRAEHGASLLKLFTRLRPLLSDAAWLDCHSVLG